MLSQHTKRLLVLVALLAVAGLAVSGYSYLHKTDVASGEFCSVDATFNCDVVNKGPYSEIFGVPVALIGILGYLFLGAAAFLKMKQPEDGQLTGFLVIGATGGLLFSAYLTGIEAFVLETWCLLCLTSQTIIIIIFAAVLWVWYNERKAHQRNAEEDVTKNNDYDSIS